MTAGRYMVFGASVVFGGCLVFGGLVFGGLAPGLLFAGSFLLFGPPAVSVEGTLRALCFRWRPGRGGLGRLAGF